MNRSLRVRALLALAVLALSLYVAVTVPIRLGLDLRGGTQIVLETRSTPTADADSAATDRTLEVLRGRIDALGVAEPTLVRSGDHRIIVELPGVQDPKKAADVLGRTAQLTFHPVLGAADDGDDTSRPLPKRPRERVLPDESGTSLRLGPTSLAGEDVKEGTFWRADLNEAADHLVEVIREIRPQVMVTYDVFGGYGHPDHIQAHRVATYAAFLAAVPSYRLELGPAHEIDKIYWTAMSESRLRDGLRRLREMGDTTTFEGMDPDQPLPRFAIPDEFISAAIDANDFVDAKLRAMKAHATQIQVDGPFFALSNNIGNEVWGTEFYRLAKGRQGPTDENGWETDLFAGL